MSQRIVKGAAIGIFAAAIATFAALLGDIDKIAKFVVTKCIGFEICSPGNHFVNVAIRAADPTSPSIGALFKSKPIELDRLVSGYSSSVLIGPEFNGLSFEPTGGPSGNGEIDGQPYQVAAEDGYYAPEQGSLGWLLGFPIFDLLVGEKGSVVDITEIIIDVYESNIDAYPYVQIFSRSVDFASLFLINESVHKEIVAKIEFNVSTETDISSCYNAADIEKLDFDDFKFGVDRIDLTTTAVVDVSGAIAKNVPDFQFRKYWNLLVSVGIDAPEQIGQHMSKPDGYDIWAEKNGADWVDPRLDQEYVIIYGRLTAREKASSNSEHKSYFCSKAFISPTPGVGGGYIEFDESRIVDLQVQSSDYQISHKIDYRIDGNNSHFRTALMLRSEKSSYYELFLELKSYDRTVYKSDPIKVHVVVPSLTASCVLTGCFVDDDLLP
ncbi:hypothetical protein ACVDG9_06085 [Roseibium sp. RP-7]